MSCFKTFEEFLSEEKKREFIDKDKKKSKKFSELEKELSDQRVIEIDEEIAELENKLKSY